MTVDGRPVEERQNDPGLLRLQRAASRAHVSAQRWSRLRLSAAVAFAAAGLAVHTVDAVPDGAADAVVVSGLLWALLHLAFVTPRLNVVTAKAAVVQEQFDTELLRLPWNDLLGKPLRDDEIQSLDRRFHSLRPGLRTERERKTRDWYDVETVGVQWPYDAILCQRQNLAWDARLRRDWSALLKGVLAAWAVVCVVLAILAEMSMLDTLLRLFAPSLPAMQLAYMAALDHRLVAEKRERATSQVEAVLATYPHLEEPAEARMLTRQIQDVLWTTRTKASRVPQWFYRLYRSPYMDDFLALSRSFRQRVGLRAHD